MCTFRALQNHEEDHGSLWSGVMIVRQRPFKQALVAEAWSSFSEGFRRKKNDED
jgi:hypothetical protein